LFGTDTPAVDLRVLANHSFAAAWVSIMLLGFGLIGAVLLQSLFLQEVLGYTAAQTGLAFMPRGMVTMITSPISGLLLNRMGPKIMATIGTCCAAVAVFLMSRWTLDTGPLQITIPLVIVGFGLSMLFIPLMTSGLSAVGRRNLTGAAGLLNLQFQLGASFGTAVLATMIESGIQRYHAHLVEQAVPTNPAFSGLLSQVSHMMTAKGGSDAVTAQQQAYAMLDNIITAQASVLSFEHAFQFVASILLLILVCVPFLHRASGASAGVH
jgi:DHA2 family multidrug resistance protein